jgi:hypothetical protein
VKCDTIEIQQARKLSIAEKGKMTQEIMKWTLTSNCVCVNENDEPSENCYDCYVDELDLFKSEMLMPYLAGKGWELNTPIKVSNSRLGWRGVSGYAYTTPEKLIDTLTFDGDWTLRFEFDGHDLTAVRSSHDEPMGTGKFEIELSDEVQDE